MCGSWGPDKVAQQVRNIARYTTDRSRIARSIRSAVFPLTTHPFALSASCFRVHSTSRIRRRRKWIGVVVELLKSSSFGGEGPLDERRQRRRLCIASCPPSSLQARMQIGREVVGDIAVVDRRRPTYPLSCAGSDWKRLPLVAFCLEAACCCEEDPLHESGQRRCPIIEITSRPPSSLEARMQVRRQEVRLRPVPGRSRTSCGAACGRVSDVGGVLSGHNLRLENRGDPVERGSS